MSWLTFRNKMSKWVKTDLAQRIFELGLSLLVGLLAGLILAFSWKLSSNWRGLIILSFIGFAFVMFVNDLEKLILALLAVSVPLNLDISLVISPYARNPENLARGTRTLIALTELRVSLVTILMLLGYALWILEYQKLGRKPARFFSSTTLPALGLVFLSILSTFQASDFQLALFRVAQLVELFLMYFYLVNHLRTIEEMQFFVMVSTGAMLAEALLMLVQWVTGLEFIIAGIEANLYGAGRVAGTLNATGPAAGYLSAQGLITCAMIWVFPQARQKALAMLSFGVSVLALVSTGSRIGWAAFAVTLFVFVVLGLRSGRIRQTTLLLLLVGILIIGVGFYDVIYARYTEDDRGSAESRLMMYRLAWKMIRARPWLGVGAGNYSLATRAYYTSDVGDAEQVLDIQVHNRYLTIWAESGTFALLCYVGFLGIAMVHAFSCVHSSNHWIAMMGMGLGAAILSLCIQMFTGTFQVRPITLFTWFLPALASSLRYLEEESLIHEQVLEPSVRSLFMGYTAE